MSPLALLAAQRVSEAALLAGVDVGLVSADLAGWARRAILLLETAYRSQSAARGDSIPATWEALNMARKFASALAPSSHAGHGHVPGWYERDIQAALRRVLTMPMAPAHSAPEVAS